MLGISYFQRYNLTDMDGILIVDKPKGMTSHDVVDFIRRRFGLKKVGHAGTLDPMATGVLVMLVGKATKSSGRLMAHDKEYDAEMILGQVSDTGDGWGRLTATDSHIDLRPEAIRRVFMDFTGDIEQSPPMYSAVKYEGKKLYELARKGIIVDVKPRKVNISKLEILKISLPQVEFKVSCSKGTYIRQLCVDIGSRLGCGAHLSKLRRTRSGDFSIDQALPLDRIGEMAPKDLEACLLREELAPAS